MAGRLKISILGAIAVFTGMVIVILLGVLLIKERANTGCQICPFEVDPHPLIVLSGTSDFIYPEPGEKLLKFSSHQSLDFICPGQRVITDQSTNNYSIISGTCESSSIFTINGREVDWKEIKCSNNARRTIRSTGNRCANNKGTELEIGFDTGDNRFLRSLLICFNSELQISYYTYMKQTAAINERALNIPRPRRLQGSELYDIYRVNHLYTRSVQRRTINRLLGLPDNSTKYIKDESEYFLSGGHISSSSDNFYAAQQNASFFVQNTAPQWNTINIHNWRQIEIDVRNYGDHNAVDLQIWTGVHGVTTLPHEETGEPTELYLYVDETTNWKALPVPKIFWKIVFNPITERGIALIGANNPYNSTFEPICIDVSSRLTWLHCNRHNQEQGFCYACSVDTFRRVVTSMPYIPVRGLLL